MSNIEYIMEGPDEALRLDLKVDPTILAKHAIWAGIKPGMRVVDLGCGPGKTTFFLNNKSILKYSLFMISITKSD